MTERQCRICFEANNTISNPLMSPCKCNGTSKYVHKECIEQWRSMNRNNDNYRRRHMGTSLYC